MPAPAPIRLSKSKFVAGVQCLKRLYFQVHQPELADEAGDDQQARLEQGQEVGLLAQQRFPGGVAVGFENGVDHALSQTAALLDNPSVPAIFEATFQHANLLVRVDILQRRPRCGAGWNPAAGWHPAPKNRWRLIEVKSSLDRKDYHLPDVAIQHHVLIACGLDISSACLMHLNRAYIYDGIQHDLASLFTIRNLTSQVKKLDADLPRLLKLQRKALAQTAPPGISPGPQCSDPYVCEFFSHCNPSPPEHHISSLPNLSAKKAQTLADRGISLIRNIPDDFQLSDRQARICAAVKTGQMWLSESIPKELSRLRHPLFFMDFESCYPALPRFAGMWPYSQIPFQWSVHRQLADSAPLEHFEFLSDDERDPRPMFIESLCEVLGKRGQIVAYNATFESQRLAELADALPEYKQRIQNIRGRLWDLLPFVRDARLPSAIPRLLLHQIRPARAGARHDVRGHGRCRRNRRRPRLGTADPGRTQSNRTAPPKNEPISLLPPGHAGDGEDSWNGCVDTSWPSTADPAPENRTRSTVQRKLGFRGSMRTLYVLRSSSCLRESRVRALIPQFLRVPIAFQ